MAEWVVVAGFENMHDASYAMALLSEAGIQNTLKHRYTSQLMSNYVIVGSPVKLQVLDGDVKAALEILLREGIVKENELGPDKWLQKTADLLSGVGWKWGKNDWFYLLMSLFIIFALLVYYFTMP